MNQKKATILIIEDEPSIRKIFNIALASVGSKVVECDNGREGMRLTVEKRSAQA